MEKVVNSVQQILQECRSMISKTDNCEFVDVTSLAKSLESECALLENYFELSPEDEASIKKQKQVVERLAIRMEFFMSVRLHLYENRYKLRSFSSRLYKDCKDLTLALNAKKDVPDRELISWGANTHWALAFYARSMHVIFETGDDDEKHIKDIVENMKIIKERYKI